MNQGAILKSLIRREGITQEDFAKKINKTRGYVQQLISRSRLSDEIINMLSEALNVEIKVFYSKEHVNNNPVTQSSKTSENVELLKIQLDHYRDKCLWLEEKADFYKKENERLEEEIKTFIEQKTG